MTVKLILEGIVQGVFCRGYCSQYAKKLRIHGSATNLSNGTVRILLETDEKSVIAEYISYLKTNPLGFTFYGRIDNIHESDYRGPVSGDYRF